MKAKEFDCVQMKWEVQQQIRRELAGVPEAEARERQMRLVAQDPVLGPLYKRLTAAKGAAGKR